MCFSSSLPLSFPHLFGWLEEYCSNRNTYYCLQITVRYCWHINTFHPNREQSSMTDLKRGGRIRQRRGVREECTVNQICCLSKHPLWTWLHWEHVFKSLGSLQCWFLPTCRILLFPLSLLFFVFFYFSSYLLSRLSCIKHGSLKYLELCTSLAASKILILTLFIVFWEFLQLV